MQEDCQALVVAIMEKKMKARGSGCPQGSRGPTWSSVATCNIDDWMWDLDKGAPNGEVRSTGHVCTHGYNQCGACAQHVGGGGRWYRWQGIQGVLRGSSGSGSSDGGSYWGSLHLTMTRTSRGSNRSAGAGRGLWVKVNLLIFKDKKSKDAVIYCSWWWDVAIFHQSGWDDQHLLPYVFHSLQGFPGNLARSLGKDATLSDILHMLDENYGVVMMFNALSKELYSLKQGLSKNVAEYGVCLLQQVQILQSEYLGSIQQEHMEEVKCNCFYEGHNPKYWPILANKVDGKPLASYPDLLLAAWKLERWAEARGPKPPMTAVTNGPSVTCSQTLGNLFP